MSKCNTSVVTNPFASARIRPGAIPYLCPENLDLDERVEWFTAHRQRGQIVGPHGSGKTTLLIELAKRLRVHGYSIQWLELHDGQRWLPGSWYLASSDTTHVVLCVDGYEQLGYLERLRLRFVCWYQQWGLLVTTHRAVSLPIVCELNASLNTATQVLGQLLSIDESFDTSDLEQLLARHRGNLREVLFDLYDRYERQHRSSGASNPADLP